MLRLDWNILFNIINLIILYLLMKRFLFKPVNAILEKRQAEADSRLAQADEKETQAKECLTKYETLLHDAEDEKNKIVQQARTEASEEYGRIIDEAKEKAGVILEDARDDARKEKEAVLRQADTAIRDIVLTAAARMTGAMESSESDRRLYDKFIENTVGQNELQNGE